MSETREIRVLAVDHAAGVPLFRKKFAALARQPGIDLTVLAPDRWVENYRPVRLRPAPDTSRDGYRLRTGSVVWPGYENRGFFTTGLLGAMRDIRPDILHLWEEPFSFIAFQALAARRLLSPRTKALFYSADNLTRSFRYPYRPSFLYKRIELASFRACERGTALSRDVAEVLRAKGFRGPIDVLPLALDPEDYPPAGRSGPERAPARKRVVGYAGKLTRQKGVDTLLRAFAAIGPKGAGSDGGSDAGLTELWIVGDGPERRALGELAGSLGLGARVRFKEGVPHESMPEIYRLLDVLVLPSRTLPRAKEQFGRVLIEAMASGCVVVGSSSGAIPEVIGDAGLVFPEEDARALGAALTRALHDSDLAATLRERGRRRVLERFTWEGNARRLVAIYREMIGGAGRGGRESPRA